MTTDIVRTASSKTVISKLRVITYGCRFCSIKETDNSNFSPTSLTLAVMFSLGSAAQTKLFAISRILAENVCNQPNLSQFFLVFAIIRLIRISSEFLSASLYFNKRGAY